MISQACKRLLAMLLAICLTAGAVAPVVAYAEGTDPDAVVTAGTDEIIDDQSEGGQPEGGQPEGGQPEDGQTEGGQPEDGQTEGGQPEGGQPEDGQTEGGQPEEGQTEDGQVNDDEIVDDEVDNDEEPAGEDEDTEGEEQLIAPVLEEELQVTNYADFLENLKVLEGYADEYAAIDGVNSTGVLVLNYIRTGVERYNDFEWQTLAGAEITGFVTYVAQQDALNNTTAGCLRNIVIDNFLLPNGNQVDFGHMFGTMNISYVSSNEKSADLAGWAGDICDLLFYSKFDVTVPAGTLEEQTAYILANCFGVNADNAFGMDDFYGDMDALYLIAQMKDGSSLSAAMESYFTEDLSDADRSEFFMKNRFEKLFTRESVREAVYNAYAGNTGIIVLEAKRGLSDETQLRQACCYAFADYVYDLAGDTLEEPEDTEDPEEPKDNPYYSVFSSETTNLAPGISQTIKYAYTADNKQIAYYLAEVDVTRDDVTIMAGYRDADPSKGWGMQRATDQVKAMNAKHSNPEDPDNYIENFRVIAATNGAGFNMTTGEPGGLLVMEGKEWHEANAAGFFGIMKDGSARIGTTAEYNECKDQVQEAIAGFGAVLIKDGQIVTKDNSGRASRTAIGIKADGAVVMMVLDGRQEPFSAGGSMVEIAQIMLDAGCVEAINLDGGGSTTFVAKPEGSDDVAVINRPSDGYQRSVSTTLMAVSTAKTSNEFSHANITSEYDYLTIGTDLQMTAVGVSESGNSAPVPEGALWRVTDASKGSITQDGVFTAADNGEVEVQLILNGEVIGRKTLCVTLPDTLEFTKNNITLIYGVPAKLPLVAYYNGNSVKFNDNDIAYGLSVDDAGTFEGLYFTVNESSNVKKLQIGAMLIVPDDPEAFIYALTSANVYSKDEAYFDFENATSGNRTLAWVRTVTNSETEGDDGYHVITPGEDMTLEYTFGLDMTSISVPAQLEDLTFMLPGADAGMTAWDFLLALAERIGELTEVRISVQLDEDMDADISQMKISNEYFYLKSAEVSQSNLLTVVCGWVDQTQAIDSSTANPICILSGIRMTPRDGAVLNDKGQIEIVNNGTVSYRIFMRASALYSFAKQPANQATYGLKPYSGDQEEFYFNGKPLMNGTKPEQGAYFGTTYADFLDTVTLDPTDRNGWYTVNGQAFYYKNNQKVTDLQYLPGQKDPENLYFYRFAEDGSLIGAVNGLVEWKGDLYYALNGAPKTGWVSIMNGTKVDYYFFNTWSKKALDGVQKIGDYTYTFTDHILTKGQLVTNSTGTRYMWAGAWASQEWLNIDGKIAYAKSNNYFETGLKYRYSPEGDWTYYAFSEDGWWMEDFTGIYDWNGGTYLIREGIVIPYPGLFELDGDYYYISSNNVLVKNRQYWISKTNDLVPTGSYWFDADGKLVLPEQPETPDPDKPVNPEPEQPKPEQPEAKKNGILEEEGKLWYYVDGVKTYAGLIQIDGNYYYVRTSGELARNCTYWVTKTNGLLPEKAYDFDADGKLILPAVEPEQPDPEQPEAKKNGILEEDGRLWYYVDGEKVYAGLIQIDGYYYYVRTSGELARSCDYWTTKNNGLLKSAMYTFDAKGRMVNPPEEKPVQPDAPVNPGTPAKNGIQEEDGKLWYYYNGVKTYAGLIKLDGNYYYVRTSGELARNCKYWITKTNDLLPEQSYTFDVDGKILDVPMEEPEDPETPAPVKHGIVAERGSLYFYEEGKLVYAGLIYVDGYYYYVRTSGELAHDCKYWPTKDNGLFKVTRQYTFDSQGRMVDPPV